MNDWVNRTLAAWPTTTWRSTATATDNAKPIFIVGLPRSGTTLVEQILGSHSQIEATTELPYLNQIARRILNDREYLTCVDLSELGHEYLALAQMHRHTDKPYFINKQPINYAHIAWIKAMLPNARIVDVRRHPLASCTAMFRQHFIGLPQFAGSIDDIAVACRDYIHVMERFDAALPGAVHRIHYERLATDTEREVQRLLEYIGVPFEDACLHWYANGQPVRTPSAAQVRQPIYHHGLNEWTRFESELDGAKRILGQEIAAYPV